MIPEFYVYVKNIDTEAYALDELPGVSIDPDEEINLMDSELGNHYSDPQAALRAINELIGTTLYQGVHGDPVKLEYRVVPMVGMPL